MRLPQKAGYRFSELHVGRQGIVEVERIWAVSGDPRDPLVLTVTGDVTIEGGIYAIGTDGGKGENGSGSDDGGYGGAGGLLAAGAGGIGGPTSPTKYDRNSFPVLSLHGCWIGILPLYETRP